MTDHDRGGINAGLLVLLTAAAALRLWAWGSVGLDHFDEGGYAMSAGAIASGAFADGRYPLQHFLSPPFQFGTAGELMLLFGISDQLLLGLSACLGIGTVAVVYLATFRWLGRSAAIASGTLTALADFHVLYSRSGLTDVSFGFWFLLALWCLAEAERRESWSWAVLAGIVTGVAWNTKYHGWLAIVIAGGALLPSFRDRELRAVGRAVARVALAGGVGLVLYLPWALFVQAQPGGYAGLTLEHAMYLHPTQVLQQAWTHFNTQMYLDGWSGRLAPGGAALWLALSSPEGQRIRASKRAGLVGVFGVVAGNSVFVGLAALAAVVGLARSRSPGVRVALAFFAVFTLLTPLYTPYPRLVLPWLLAGWVLAGVGLSRFIGTLRDLPPSVEWTPYSKWSRAALTGLVLLLGTVAVWTRPPWEAAGTHRAKDGFREAAAQVAELIPEGGTVVVWGEPGVVFYLRARLEHVVHVDDLQDIREYTEPAQSLHLVTSIYAGRIGGESGLEGWRAANPGVLTEVSAVPVRDVSDVRLLDDYGPVGAARFLQGEDNAYDLRLFAVDLR